MSEIKDLLEFCSGTMPERSFDAGEVILEEGGREGVLYVLAEGSVEVLKGEYRINLVTEPGSFFGEMSVLLALPHTATVKTVTPARFYVADDPRAFMSSRPEIALAISTLLARRLHAMTTYLVDLKSQFEDQTDHLGMVDDVLATLSHAQGGAHKPGSERDPDPTVY